MMLFRMLVWGFQLICFFLASAWLVDSIFRVGYGGLNTSVELTLILTIMLITSLPAIIAHKKGRNFSLWWIYGWALFIIAIIHAIVLKPNEKSLLDGGMKKCPFCAEIIKPEAKVCRFCGRDIA